MRSSLNIASTCSEPSLAAARAQSILFVRARPEPTIGRHCNSVWLRRLDDPPPVAPKRREPQERVG